MITAASPKTGGGTRSVPSSVRCRRRDRASGRSARPCRPAWGKRLCPFVSMNQDVARAVVEHHGHVQHLARVRKLVAVGRVDRREHALQIAGVVGDAAADDDDPDVRVVGTALHRAIVRFPDSTSRPVSVGPVSIIPLSVVASGEPCFTSPKVFTIEHAAATTTGAENAIARKDQRDKVLESKSLIWCSCSALPAGSIDARDRSRSGPRRCPWPARASGSRPAAGSPTASGRGS